MAPDTLLYIAALFVFASVWRFQDLWPILGKLKLSLLVEIALAVLFFTDSSPVRKLKWSWSPIFMCPLLLLGIMIIGLPLSLYPGLGLVIIEKDFMPTVLLFTVVAISMRESRDLEWFALALFVGALVYSLWVYIYIPVGSSGRLGNLEYYDANDLSVLIDCTIPISVYFLRPGVTGWKRLLALFGLALLVVMLMKTGSRGGFLGFIAVMLYILFRYRGVPKRLRIAAVAGGAIILVGAGSTAYFTLMRSILHPESDYNSTSDTGRKAIWKRGIGYMLAHPVVGVGVGSFGQAEGRLSTISKEYASSDRGLKWSTAHNSFVLAGAELGITGLVIFIAMIYGSMRVLARIRTDPQKTSVVTDSDEAYAQMLIGSLVGYCVAAFFVSGTYFAYLYVIIGLGVALKAVLRRRTARSANAVVLQPSGTATRVRRVRPARAHWSPAG